jgi:solute carrier family 25 oxoglutarate transporter 11
MSSTNSNLYPLKVVATKPLISPTVLNFGTAGLGGIMGWCVVHPFNTLCVRMNLASASGQKLSFLPYMTSTIKESGFLSLYTGLSAGILRQTCYATSRFGLFEVFRDEMAKYRPTDIWSRLSTGMVSGGIAALISCPAEVTLVRISNDNTLPPESRRNYKGVADAFKRILNEEGVKTFFSGSGPFVNRAMLVGAVQVGTYDQFRDMYRGLGITSQLSNVFSASMTSGLIYAVVTMPLETAKNRMAFQKPDPSSGVMPYRGAIQTMSLIAKNEGILALWSGFPPYYLRCGGHTVLMFMSVEWLRKTYHQLNQ